MTMLAAPKCSGDEETVKNQAVELGDLESGSPWACHVASLSSCMGITSVGKRYKSFKSTNSQTETSVMKGSLKKSGGDHRKASRGLSGVLLSHHYLAPITRLRLVERNSADEWAESQTSLHRYDLEGMSEIVGSLTTASPACNFYAEIITSSVSSSRPK